MDAGVFLVGARVVNRRVERESGSGVLRRDWALEKLISTQAYPVRVIGFWD